MTLILIIIVEESGCHGLPDYDVGGHVIEVDTYVIDIHGVDDIVGVELLKNVDNKVVC